jgi:hypothetical protein
LHKTNSIPFPDHQHLATTIVYWIPCDCWQFRPHKRSPFQPTKLLVHRLYQVLTQDVGWQVFQQIELAILDAAAQVLLEIRSWFWDVLQDLLTIKELVLLEVQFF